MFHSATAFDAARPYEPHQLPVSDKRNTHLRFEHKLLVPVYCNICAICAEHNTDMLIYAAIQGGQYRVAREWATKIRSSQEELHTAAYGDASHSWTHLPLVHVSFQQSSCQSLRIACTSQEELHTAADDSASRSWTHLLLVHVTSIGFSASASSLCSCLTCAVRAAGCLLEGLCPFDWF